MDDTEWSNSDTDSHSHCSTDIMDCSNRFTALYDDLGLLLQQLPDNTLKSKILLVVMGLCNARLKEVQQVTQPQIEKMSFRDAVLSVPKHLQAAKSQQSRERNSSAVETFPLLISTKDNVDGRLTQGEFADAKKLLTEKLKPGANSLQVNRTWPAYNGKVGIAFNTEESRRKAVCLLAENNINTEVPQRRGTELVAFHSNDISAEDFTTTLLQQNDLLKNYSAKDIVVLKHKDNVTFLRCTTELGQAILARGKFGINFEIVRFEVRKTRPICFKCLGVGHISVRCRAKEAICWRCSKTGHQGDACTSTKTRCYHCKQAGKPAHVVQSHMGRNTAQCPVLRALWC